MIANILGQVNIKIHRIDGSSVRGIEGMLEKFLEYYNRHPELKNLPILLTFEELEDKMMNESFIFRGETESEFEFKLRILDMTTKMINESRRLIVGFRPNFVIGGDTLSEGQKRKVGIVFYEPPFYTASEGENSLPDKDHILPYYTIIGRTIPPAP